MSKRRYTIDVGEDFDALLTVLAVDNGLTKAEIIRRSVATYGYLQRQTSLGTNRKVSITTNDDVVVKDVVLT